MKTIWSISPEPNQKMAPRMWTYNSTDRSQTTAAGESSICADEPAMEARADPETGGARGRAGAIGAGGCGQSRQPALRRSGRRAADLGVPAVWALRERDGVPVLARGASHDVRSAVLRDHRQDFRQGAGNGELPPRRAESRRDRGRTHLVLAGPAAHEARD